MTDVWIDTHAHLDEAAFADDQAAVVAAAHAAGVRTIMNVGYQPDRWPTTRRLTETFPGVRAMYGLHPNHADAWTTTTRLSLERLLGDAAGVAIGEIGLDYFRPGPDVAQQRCVFNAQLDLAGSLGLPVVIHQRSAEADLIAELASLETGRRVLLHSFEGTSALANLAVDHGFFIGVGGLATKSANAALRVTLATIPVAQIVLETDAPYLIPAGVRGQRNTPASIPVIGSRLAAIWNLTPADLAKITTANAERFFNLQREPGQ